MTTPIAPVLYRVAFTDYLDLANEKVGGKVISASDDFFAEKENLIKNDPAVFIVDKYTTNGKWMDGWESRRKRVKGYDWAIIKLGIPGVIKGFDVDTSFFTGNYPEYCSIEASIDGKKFFTIAEKQKLQGSSHNFITVNSNKIWNFVRLNSFPDGGVARLRVYGEVKPDFKKLQAKGSIDLACVVNGGAVVSCSDMFYGNKDNLLFPSRAPHMGEGWETKRSRGEHSDWIIVKLGAAGTISKIEIDTNHFKGNFPDSCKIEALNAPLSTLACDFRDNPKFKWIEVLPQVKLKAHNQAQFSKELQNLKTKYSHLKITIYPDGGISRLRVFGKV
jgi:allantoicase